VAGAQFACEFKYDGERAQLHMLNDRTIHIFSRRLETHTGKYPDLIQMIPDALQPDTTSFIADAEVVAYNRERHKILPFQTLSRRGRKDIKIQDIKVWSLSIVVW